jgi:hypothetical protein
MQEILPIISLTNRAKVLFWIDVELFVGVLMEGYYAESIRVDLESKGSLHGESILWYGTLDPTMVHQQKRLK